MSVKEALEKAEAAHLDLVEIQPNAEPPVCRIMDYGKFLYSQNKQQAAQKKKQTVTKVKEVKLTPRTDEGDVQVKLRNLRRFLENGDKVKVTIWFRGREMAHQELGFQLLERIKAELDEIAKVESFPKLEGRQLIMVMAPKKK